MNTYLLYRHRWRRPSLLWLRTAWERPLSGTTNCRDLWVRLTPLSLCVLFLFLWIVLFRSAYFISLPFSQVCWQSQILSIFFIGITGHLWWVAIPATSLVLFFMVWITLISVLTVHKMLHDTDIFSLLVDNMPWNSIRPQSFFILMISSTWYLELLICKSVTSVTFQPSKKRKWNSKQCS